MKKPLTILLTLFLFSSVYADERMSKDDLLKQWEGNVITMNGLHKKPISFKVSNNELIYINNGDSSVTDAWIRDNGKLCIEYRYQDDCHRVIKTSEGIFTVKGLASTQSFRKGTSTTYKKNILTLSGEAREMLSEQTTFKNTIADENGITSTSSEKQPSNNTNSQYKFTKLSKDDIFNTFYGKTLLFKTKIPHTDKKSQICIKIDQSSSKAIPIGEYKTNSGQNIECNTVRIRDVYAEYMSGKLCIETRDYGEKCRIIRKFSNGKYKFGISPISIYDKLTLKEDFKTPISPKSTVFTYIGPDSAKITVFDVDGVEQTIHEEVFVDRNSLVKGEKESRRDWEAKWKAAWKEGRTIDDLTREEFVLNPELEDRFNNDMQEALELFYSDNKHAREEAVAILRKLAFAGSVRAYYYLIFMSHDSSYEQDYKLPFDKLFGNMFEYSYGKRPKTEVSNEMLILAQANPNNNTDQNELIRSLLLLYQKKFQHYNVLLDTAGGNMFLTYMSLSITGSQSDAKTEHFLATRFDRNEMGGLSDYLLTNEEIVSNLEKEAEEGDVTSMFYLVNMYHPKDRHKTLKQIVPPNDSKAIYYSKKIINHIKTHKDDIDIKKSPSLAKKAYETLRELKDESMLKEVNLYFKDIDEAKANRQRQIREQGRLCTVSFMEGSKPKRKTYTYYKTEDCLAHIKHADENGYLDQGRFKNGNNPLIFWGPNGTYEGTKNLMKTFKHKPLNK